MKKTLLSFLIIAVTLAMAAPFNLFCQSEKEPADEGPVQAHSNPMAWMQLSKMESLKNLQIKEIQTGKVLQFNLGNIKQALVKARITEKVSIFYIAPTGDEYHLGDYAPYPAIGAKRPGSGKDAVLINPQPEPPGFPAMPMVKQVSKSATNQFPSQAAAAKAGKTGLLIFKNIKGLIKATIQLRPSLSLRTKNDRSTEAER